MTEQDWLACTDPQKMLEFLRGPCVPKDELFASGEILQVPDYPHSKISHRQLRLFACACCRRIWHLLRDERSRQAVEVSERYADGRATEQQLGDAAVAAEDAASTAYFAAHDSIQAEALAAGLRPELWNNRARVKAQLASSAEHAAFETTHLRITSLAGWESAAEAGGAANNARAAVKVEQQAQAELLRCILGNPFRPVGVDPGWLRPSVVELARTIYEERAFDRLPVLADALEESGCSNADILGHLRGPGPHARGCWAIDLLTGKP